MVLGKLSEPGRPTDLDNSKTRSYCACSRYGWGLFGRFFLSSIFSLFFLPFSGADKPKTTNQRTDAVIKLAHFGPFQ